MWVAAVLALQGCASAPPSGQSPRGMYDPQQLGQFLKETAPSPGTNEYVVGIGDRLDVVFFFHQDMSTLDLLVRSDGRITLPYLGDVMAAGFTPMQLDTLLESRFGEILKDPNLSVIVRDSEEPTVYVIGQVDKPGAYQFSTTLSLVQSVAMAGGTVRGAKTENVIVIRRAGLNRIVGVEVNMKAIIDGKSIQNDFPLRNMDIVLVPKTRMESIASVMQTIDDIVAPPSNLAMRGWQIFLIQQQVDNLVR